MICKRCPAEIRTRPNAKYCDPCKEIVRKEVEARAAQKKYEYQRSARLKAPVLEKKHKRTIITDEQQMAINRACDKDFVNPMFQKVYTPGTAAFKAAAKDIIERRGIRGRISSERKDFSILPSSVRQYVTT